MHALGRLGMRMRAEVGSLPGIPKQLRPWAPIALVATGIALVVLTVVSLFPIDDLVMGIRLDPAVPPTDSPPAAYERAATQFEQADPVADAVKAIDSGDTRLWVARGNGWTLPGAEHGRQDYYRRHYGLRFFHTSCVVDGDAHAHFLAALEAYAEQYNATILSSVRR
jgi:hypothetical protein